jgi:hypothetical protein
MADKPRNPEPSKTETEKKQAETVHLTPEELRKISGGVGFSNPLPVSTSNSKPQPS